MSLCTLIPAIVGLISGILGYLLGKMSSKGDDNNSSLSLQSDLDACRANSKSLSARISTLEADLASAKSNASKSTQSFTAAPSIAASIPFDGDLAFSVMGKKIKQDDLKIVEGIGPKIEELYHAAGITTWKGLSETSVEKSQSILDAAGERYAVHNPSTWAKQAQLAYEGKWQELKDWQDSLDGGKE
jgi:predicted flap endonuclease-1-like 5' DNA nuclease